MFIASVAAKVETYKTIFLASNRGKTQKKENPNPIGY